MILILGEAIFIGVVSGACSARPIRLCGDQRGGGGLKFPIAFFLPGPSRSPDDALWWGAGPESGGGTAVLGSILPALVGPPR